MVLSQANDFSDSGGFNVYPAEVEAVLDSFEGVAESAVIGVPHPDFGEGVIAVLAAKPGETLSDDTIRASLTNQLAKFKQPKKFHVLDALPRNTMGKIQKNVLRERYQKDFA